MRTFSIFTEPHVADPAWVMPVAERTADGVVEHTDANELLKVALELHHQLGVSSGIAKENFRTRKFMESKGWSEEQIKEWAFYR